MHKIVESSEKAKRMFVYPNFAGKFEFSESVGTKYKMGFMKAGQSIFFLKREGCTKEVTNKIRRTVSFVNNNYKAFFVVIVHNDKVELARLC